MLASLLHGGINAVIASVLLLLSPTSVFSLPFHASSLVILTTSLLCHALTGQPPYRVPCSRLPHNEHRLVFWYSWSMWSVAPQFRQILVFFFCSLSWCAPAVGICSIAFSWVGVPAAIWFYIPSFCIYFFPFPLGSLRIPICNDVIKCRFRILPSYFFLLKWC